MKQNILAVILLFLVIEFTLVLSHDTREMWSTLRAADVADMTERHKNSLDEIKKINFLENNSGISYRLPNNSKPISYDVFIITDIDQGLFNYTGRVKIHLEITGQTQSITLHYRNQSIVNIDWLSPAGNVRAKNLTYQKFEEVEMLVINLPSVVINGEYMLDILFTSELDTRRGFYRSSYIDQWGAEKWVASTQFSPIDARHAIICYDEPRYRAVFKVSIQHNKNYHALSNMPVQNITEVSDTHYVITKFNDSLSMPSYLLAFTISNFDYIQNNDVDIPQRIFAKPESIKNGEGDFIINEIGPILRMCDKLFGVPHALPKLDHVAVPYHVYSAMENYGLYTYAEWNLLLDPSESPQYTMLEIIAHEIAHHLFGNYVNLPFWDKLFLKEGFATLYQFVIPAKIYPEKYFKHGLRTKACVRAAAIDITTSNSMTTYVETEAEIRAKFDAISYSKAGCFYGMIMNAITEETWFKAMHYYLTTNALQTSDIDDVHKAIQKAIDEDFGTSRFDIAPIMKSWENQPGFPIVKVEKINGKVRLTQERFWTKSGHIYSIPINHATKSSPDFTETKATLWMHNETFEFHPNDMALNDWIIINIQQTGYYRANYAVDIWNSITEELLTNHTMIHWINRQQLFIDMEYALTSGCVSPINSFDHLKYLKNEDVADVWTQGGILINDIRGKFYDTEVDDSFRQYVDSLYKNHFERIGFEASENETELRNSLIDISCRNHYEPCLNFTRNKLLNEYQTNEKFVDFCHGVRILNEDEADEIFNFMVTVNSTIRRTAAMNGLTCSHNRSFLRKFLSSMLNADYKFYTSAIRSANIRRMMSESIYGLDEVMSFLIENKNIFNNRDYFASNVVATIIDTFAVTVNSERHFERAKEIMEEFYPIYDEITSEIQQSVISRIEEKLEWKSRQNYNEIHDYFYSELGITTTEGTSTTTPKPEPDNASMISWSLASLIFLFSLVFFAV